MVYLYTSLYLLEKKFKFNISTRKYAGENSKEKSIITQGKLMPLSQFTKSFPSINISFKKESEKLAVLEHQNTHTVYFYISNNSSVQRVKKDFAIGKLPGRTEIKLSITILIKQVHCC